MIINIANKVLIYTAIGSWLQMLLPNTCLLKAIFPGETCSLLENKGKAEKAFVFNPLTVSMLALDPIRKKITSLVKTVQPRY